MLSTFLTILALAASPSVLANPVNEKANPGLCIATHCFFEAGQCALDPSCFAILTCLQVSKKKEQIVKHFIDNE